MARSRSVFRRNLGAIDSNTCASTLAGMTHSHTMQEPLLARAKPVSALTQGGGRKEMTTNGAAPGIVVGFARQR